MNQPLHATRDPVDSHTSKFIGAVERGLGEHPQKTIASEYLYDAIGSSLFDVITLLPEYGVTRADERLIERYAGGTGESYGSQCGDGGVGEWKRSKDPSHHFPALTEKGPLVYMPIDVSGVGSRPMSAGV